MEINPQDPFHSGERRVQEETGERNIALRNGKILRTQIQSGAIPFVNEQEYCALGWSSSDGHLWSAVFVGERGFARTDETGKSVKFSIGETLGALTGAEPFYELRRSTRLGTLFIEFATRKRLRINGALTESPDGVLNLRVEEAYANCPKYIQRRNLRLGEKKAAKVLRSGTELDLQVLAWIFAADTFFVSSAHPAGAMDVSHRGGRTGFIRYQDGNLMIPDYPGNSMFNTFGNFLLNPKAGLCFVDFDNNCQLLITGESRLALTGDTAQAESGGTGRWWSFATKRFMITTFSYETSWSFLEASPFNP